jgi:hypothetical protein
MIDDLLPILRLCNYFSESILHLASTPEGVQEIVRIYHGRPFA